MATSGGEPGGRPLRSARAVMMRRWAKQNYSWLLSVGRGVMNTSVVTFSLRHASYPLAASVAEGCAAGLQSALLQVSLVNERYACFLSGAPSERQRFARWASVSALYYGVMKLAGILFGGAPAHLGGLAALYLRTAALGTAQYPWVAAIALDRRIKAEQARGSEDRIRVVADGQTMAVSAACVCASALSSVGVPSTRLSLVLARPV